MRISEFSVKNYQFTLVVFIMVLALGANTLFNMPRGEDPEPVAPNFAIVVVYPGTSPLDMEDLVVDPIEKKVNELDDIKKVSSYISDGVATIEVHYKYSSDPDEKYQEMVREVNALKKDLPQDIYSIEIRKFTPTDVSILQLALVSENASYKELDDKAKDLKEDLEKIKSLKDVEKWGNPDQQVRVSLNIPKMAELHIPFNQVIGSMQSQNVNIPGGSVDMNTRRFNVKTSGDYQDLNDISNTIVGSSNGKAVYLRDIAEVGMVYEQARYITRLNGKRCVLVTAAQKAGQNISKVSKEFEPVLAKFQKSLPSNIAMVKNFDQSVSVNRRLSRFALDFTIAILLVSITLLPLGFRAAGVVMISIPLSLAIGLTLLSLFGYTINQLSIVGLIVALGILVDDSIVVVENIERYMRDGYSKRKAAIVASKQIGMAVLGCTATLILAFLPLLFLPEASGDFIRSLPLAVVFTVFASLVVSLTVVPFLSSRMLSNHSSPEGNIFMRGLKAMIGGSYAKLLHRALDRPILTILIALAIFGGTLLLVPRVGFSLFPKSEKPQFLINIKMPPGTNLNETNRVAQHVDSVLRQKDYVRYYTTNVGKGNPRIYYNVIQASESPNFAQVFVQLREDMMPTEKEHHIDELRNTFANYPNAKIEVKDFEQGPPVEAPVAIRVIGENLDTLRSLAFKVEDLLKHTDGTIYVNNPLESQKTDLKVRINKEKAAMLGIPVVEIDKAVRLGIAGLNIGKFRDESNDDHDIVVTLPKGNEPHYDIFKDIYVNSVTGQAVPLNTVADVVFEASPNEIKHYDKNRYVVVTAFVKSGFLTSKVNESVVKQMEQFQLPKGYSYVAAGELESQAESFGGMGTIILITTFGFLAVLILEFGTFKSTLIVLSVIPLGIIGAVLMLLATGETFSFVATVGLIALAGIEVKNSILLVDFTNQLRAEGATLDEAIQQAGEIRFVPIVLTSLTAIGGLLPLVIEYNPLYSPLALVLIGGLISSTLLSRIVTPVMYKLLPPAVKRAKQQVGV